MRTFTGRDIDPLNIRPEDVCIEDISHHLSQICRFNGATPFHYCPTPDQRILTADLQWKQAGDLRVGQELLAFDEFPHEPGAAGNRRRKYRPSIVKCLTPVKRRIIRLELSDGSTVSASAEHPWLVGTERSRNYRWERSDDIANAVSAGKPRFVRKYFEPWKKDDTRLGGWLAGIFDGEGSLSWTRSGTLLGVAQNPGVTLTHMEAALSQLGFDYGAYKNASNSNVVNIQLRGGWRRFAEILGTLGPVRLISKFRDALFSGSFNKQLDGSGNLLRVVKAYHEGKGWLTGIETSTKTYLCEGLGAHNSVAQHSWLVSLYCEKQFGGFILESLLHDAAEAYLCDMPRPIKYRDELSYYRMVEHQIQEVIFVRFGLSPVMPPDVKSADRALLVAEGIQLMNVLYEGYGPAAHINIETMSPMQAKNLLLQSFRFELEKRSIIPPPRVEIKTH